MWRDKQKKKGRINQSKLFEVENAIRQIGGRELEKSGVHRKGRRGGPGRTEEEMRRRPLRPL